MPMNLVVEHWLDSPSELCVQGSRRNMLAALLEGRFAPPTLLFSGPRHVGKTTIALLSLRSHICLAPTACTTNTLCGSCHALQSGVHPDVLVISLEGGEQSIGIEQSRRIVDFFAVRSWNGSDRWAVVIDADRLTTEASNALLKLLEELPLRSHIILTSSVPEQLLPTVRSRVPRIHWGNVEIETLEQWARTNGIVCTPVMLLGAHGCPGRLRAFEPDHGWPDPLTPLSVQAQSFSDILQSIDLQKNPQQLEQTFRNIIAWYQVLLEQAAPDVVAPITQSIQALIGASTLLQHHVSSSSTLYAVAHQLVEVARTF